MKLMTVVAASVCAVSLSARAAESVENPAEGGSALENEETPLFSVGADLDFFSAYVWRNAVQNDEMVMQPCVWGDFIALDPFSFGFSIWQNYDLTANRRNGVNKHALTETDYNIHAGWTVWTSEDEDYSFDLELGHDWYTYQGVRDINRSANPDTREIYLKGKLANPIVDVYGLSSWMYKDFGDYKQGVHFELGLNKEIDVIEDTLTAGADWNVNFGDCNYLNYLYGTASSGKYLDEEGVPTDDYDSKVYGFGGTTIKLYTSWQITEWISLKGTIAYTGLVNGPLREAIGEQGTDYDFYGAGYPRDLLWGGLSLNIEF